MNFYGGYGGSGGAGSQSSMMMISSFSAICGCLLLAVVAFMMMGGGAKEKETTTAAPIVTTGDDEVETSDLSGARLLTVGAKSLMVEGDSCGNGTIAFSESKDDKWLWKLHSAGTWNSYPTYYIESFYKNFSSACDERWLTAPTGCKSKPYLSKRENGPRQKWVLVKDGTGYQIRSLACSQSRFARQSLMVGQSGKAPFFTDGASGSTFSIDSE